MGIPQLLGTLQSPINNKTYLVYHLFVFLKFGWQELGGKKDKDGIYQKIFSTYKSEKFFPTDTGLSDNRP